jgi:hypothetical protein
VARLVERLSQTRFLAVIGASGSGKSSVVRAGLIPAIRRGDCLEGNVWPPPGGGKWPICVVTPGAHPLETLAASLTWNAATLGETIDLRQELGEGTEDTARPVALAELTPKGEQAERMAHVLRRLADARLVTVGQRTAVIAHEALIREWMRLGQWLAENREGLRLHRPLTEDAQEWQRLNYDSSMLFRGARLQLVHEWANSHRDELNQFERHFLWHSAAAEQAAARAAIHFQPLAADGLVERCQCPPQCRAGMSLIRIGP